CAMHTIGAGYRVLAVGVEDGKEQILTPQPWEFIARVEWLPDMSSLVMVAQNQDSAVPQIWSLSYPDGAARRITNDLDVYRSLSLTADGSKFVTTQSLAIYRLWVAPEGCATRCHDL